MKKKFQKLQYSVKKISVFVPVVIHFLHNPRYSLSIFWLVISIHTNKTLLTLQKYVPGPQTNRVNGLVGYKLKDTR